MANDPVSRREALRSALLFGAAAMAPAVLSIGCSKGEPTCTDTSGLSSQEMLMRSQLQYTDHSTEAGKECSNCASFKPAAPNQCGACVIVKGPINPKGYCKSWSKKA